MTIYNHLFLPQFPILGEALNPCLSPWRWVAASDRIPRWFHRRENTGKSWKIYGNHGKIYGNHGKIYENPIAKARFVWVFFSILLGQTLENFMGKPFRQWSTFMVGFAMFCTSILVYIRVCSYVMIGLKIGTSNSCGFLIIIHNSKRIIWRFRTNQNCFFTMAIAELSMNSSANG